MSKKKQVNLVPAEKEQNDINEKEQEILTENKQQIHKNTLSEFIENNQKLLTVLGVFTALMVYTSNLPIKIIGKTLSFIFFTLALLVWFELFSKFPSGSSSWILGTFENLISLLVLILVFYWLIDFREIWNQFLVVLFFIIILGIFSWLIKKFNIYNRLFKTKQGKLVWLRYILAFMLLFVDDGGFHNNCVENCSSSQSLLR